MISGSGADSSETLPCVEIVEHPASKALRFRYECEGRSAGSIPGASSTLENKTFPTIRVKNYRGRGVVLVSCVTKDYPHRPHPHSLVGKGTCNRGVCQMELTPENGVVTFANLGIQCVKKKDICDALQTREDIRVDPFRTGFDHKRQPNTIDLNVVRLCFQVFVEGREGKMNVALQPVLSEPIYDKKAMSDLSICELSHCSATVDGGTKMILLCEKVAKDNIQVRFFERRDGREVWEGFGEFKSVHVHKQVAITFRTPSYGNRQTVEPVPVYVQLRRPTDGVTSEACPFEFLPSGARDHESLTRKRRKLDDNPRSRVMRNLQAEAEKEAAMMRDTTEFKLNTMKHEACAQSFVYDPAMSHSPVLHPIYTTGGADVAAGAAAVSYRSPGNNASCRLQEQQLETSDVHQVSSPHFDYYQQQQQQQIDQQSNMSLTPSQSASDRRFVPEVLDGSTAVGTGLMEIASIQTCSFDENLNQLSSKDLAFFESVPLENFADSANALSETLSSGLSIKP